MNEIIDSLYKRKSVRVFTDKDISKEDRDLILRSAIEAPTAGNQVLYTIIDAQDQSVKDRLSVLCDNQPFIAKAKMVLVFVADCKRWYDTYALAGAPNREPSMGDMMLACSDALIAAQNTVVAAESLGIGSCYIGDIMEQKNDISELLGLKPFLFPITMLVFGYPTESQIKRVKPKRVDLDDVVMVDKYEDRSDDRLKKMISDLGSANTDFDDYVIKFAKRKYMSEFCRELNKSVEGYFDELKRID